MTQYVPNAKGKRFTEISKWKEPWFRRLSPTAKSLWLWLNDNCDYAGVIDVDLELAAFQIGEPVNKEHLTELGERLQILPDGKAWLRDFIPSQYGAKLSPACSAHQAVLKLVQAHNLPYPNPSLRVGQPLPNSCHTLKVVLAKTTGHEYEYEYGQKGGVGGNPPNGASRTFTALTLANRICANQDGWHYDNCKVKLDRLNPPGLRSVIEPFAATVAGPKILKCWKNAVYTAHGAKVDGLAKDATAYAVSCFKSNLTELCQGKDNHETRS